MAGRLLCWLPLSQRLHHHNGFCLIQGYQPVGKVHRLRIYRLSPRPSLSPSLALSRSIFDINCRVPSASSHLSKKAESSFCARHQPQRAIMQNRLAANKTEQKKRRKLLPNTGTQDYQPRLLSSESFKRATTLRIMIMMFMLMPNSRKWHFRPFYVEQREERDWKDRLKLLFVTTLGLGQENFSMVPHRRLATVFELSFCSSCIRKGRWKWSR